VPLPWAASKTKQNKKTTTKKHDQQVEGGDSSLFSMLVWPHLEYSI